MEVFAIDPGPSRSAWLVYDTDKRTPVEFGIDDNHDITSKLYKLRTPYDHDRHVFAIEMVASYGMPVGVTVFETCVWIGRFREACPGWMDYVYRHEVKMHLCNNVRAKDGNIRQALIDRFGPGRAKAIGRKASPGPLYGVKADVWAALGVAVTYAETMLEGDE